MVKTGALLCEDEDFFKTVLNNGQALIWLSDINKGCYYFNKPWLEFRGRTLEEEFGNGWTQGVHPDDFDRCFKVYNDAFDKQEKFSMVYRLKRYDGAYRPILDEGVPRFDKEGNFIGYIGHCLDVTETQEAIRLASVTAKKLQESENRFHYLMDNISSVAVQGYALDGSVTFWNKASEALYGYTKQEAMRGNLLNLIIPKEMQEGVKEAMQWMANTGESIPASELSLQRKDGSKVLVFSSHGLIKPIDAPTELFCLDIDLSEQKKAQEELRLAASVFTQAREGILISDAHGVIINVNQAFTHITGYTHDEVVGKKPSILKSGRHDEPFYATIWHALMHKGHWYGEIWNRRKNGEIYIEMLNITAIKDNEGKTSQYMALFSDISIAKEHERQLEYIAYHDALTTLPNRLLLADRLRQGMAHAKRHGKRLLVAYLDLDGFKIINDTHGHEIGDKTLVALSERMKQLLREGDTLARIGGDEFVLVLGDMLDIESSIPMLSRLLEVSEQLLEIDGLQLFISASIGVTFYPQAEEVEAEQLLRQADQAMYQAKLAGKNRYYIFDDEQDRSVRGYHESIEHIRHALHNHQFVLHYQPKVNMRTGQMVGVEALIRWEHPQKGLLSPALFLPVVENHALAVDIGEWVVNEALNQISKWKALGLTIPVSVNVGAKQLQQSSCVECLRGLLKAHPDVAPSLLELEILETSTLEDLMGVSAIIKEFRAMGITFALDDFGTGYSSLTYLKQLPVSVLKIDQTFVCNMLEDPDDLAILEGVLGLASAFSRQVIAEGVETIEQGEMLLQLGCEFAQGYVIARPMPASQLPTWLSSWSPNALWSKTTKVSTEHIPLLFACVEHRSWVKKIEKHLENDTLTSPMPKQHQCRFGVWLGKEGFSYYSPENFEVIESLHVKIHIMADELCRHKRKELLTPFHALSRALLEKIKTLPIRV